MNKGFLHINHSISSTNRKSLFVDKNFSLVMKFPPFVYPNLTDGYSPIYLLKNQDL